MTPGPRPALAADDGLVEESGRLRTIALEAARESAEHLLPAFRSTMSVSDKGGRHDLVTEHDHPYLAPWWPAGHMLGYEHGFSHQVVDFVTAIVEGTQPRPSFADGLHVQRVLDAVERSSAAGSAWIATD